MNSITVIKIEHRDPRPRKAAEVGEIVQRALGIGNAAVEGQHHGAPVP